MPILYFAIVGCLGYIGFAIAGQYDRKRQIYCDLLALCGALRSNLNYTRLSLNSVYEGQARVLKKDLKAYLTNVLGDCPAELPFLTEEQRGDVRSFFDGLGKNDAESQKQHIAFFNEIFERNLKDATLQCKERGNMYKKLSVLLGVLLCILIM